MKNFNHIDNKKYIELLSTVSRLSGLFSESSIPYINYRLAENIFCNSFNAHNLSRSDTAFDARIDTLGIGLKTFTCPGGSSTEKVAEFNSLSDTLKKFEGEFLALELAKYRNERINLAKRLYNIENSLYHIVARRENELLLFETDYECINVDKIHSIKRSNSSLQFEDDTNLYSFNFSKSTLFRKFFIPADAVKIPVEILENPFDFILELFGNKEFEEAKSSLKAGSNYVILPLYGHKEHRKYVFEKSGLNQWNAGGRVRNVGEIYIPIPAILHTKYPDFFPDRDSEFELSIPTGETFNAKVCQENSKALMTNPNKALSEWLLRKVLMLKEGELATFDKLNQLGFDSVIIYKDSETKFRIDISKLDSFEEFIIL